MRIVCVKNTCQLFTPGWWVHPRTEMACAIWSQVNNRILQTNEILQQKWRDIIITAANGFSLYISLNFSLDMCPPTLWNGNYNWNLIKAFLLSLVKLFCVNQLTDSDDIQTRWSGVWLQILCNYNFTLKPSNKFWSYPK